MNQHSTLTILYTFNRRFFEIIKFKKRRFFLLYLMDMTLVLPIQVRPKVNVCCIVPEFELDLDLIGKSWGRKFRAQRKIRLIYPSPKLV